MADPVHDVFDRFNISYEHEMEALEGVVYPFPARYPAVEHGAVEDMGRYAAVFDAAVEEDLGRDWLFRHTIAGTNACYLPDTGVETRSASFKRVAEEDIVLDPDAVSMDHLRYDMRKFMENVGTVERDWDVFAAAYDEVKDRIKTVLASQEHSF